MTKHSTIIGGSTAGRLINCPGSFKATQALPPSADKPSEFAEEGTAMHAVMSMLMEARMNKQDPLGSVAIAQTMLGATAYDRELTHEHLDTMILPALDALDELEDAYGGGFRVAEVEMRVKFPGVSGAFGTCDLVLVSDTHAIICDWKFGQGVPVAALYEDEAGELLNSQLMFYLAGAMATKHRLFVRRKLVIAIIQPRTSEPLTHTEVTRKDVKMFREDVEHAVVMAMDREPPLKKGEHCRWCPAKINCPLWTAPILGLAEAIGERVHTPDTLPDMPQTYGEYLAKAKAFVDLLAMYTKEVNDQLHSYLEEGGTVPGWRLKWKVKQRQWIDNDTVSEELYELGFNDEDVWQEKLQTFQVVEAAAKRLGVKIPDHLRVAPESTETTIAPTGDPAPVVDRALAQVEFTAALRKLT